MSTLLIVLLVVAGLCVVGGGILAAILFPVFSQAKISAQKASTLHNMKQLALGSLMYQAEYDDVYPHRFSTHSDIRDLLMPYIKNDEIFMTFNPEGGEVLPNGMLGGFTAFEIMDLRNTVMIHETEDWPNGGRNYSFADGHAKFILDLSSQELNFDPSADPFGIYTEAEE